MVKALQCYNLTDNIALQSTESSVLTSKLQELTKAHALMSPELPADVIKMAKDIKPITEIKQSGNDFVVTTKTPGKTVTNSFTIGKEADITTMDGKKLKVCNSKWSSILQNTYQLQDFECHICVLYFTWFSSVRMWLKQKSVMFFQ